MICGSVDLLHFRLFEVKALDMALTPLLQLGFQFLQLDKGLGSLLKKHFMLSLVVDAHFVLLFLIEPVLELHE